MNTGTVLTIRHSIILAASVVLGSTLGILIAQALIVTGVV